MCEVLRLLRTKWNHAEPVHAVPMCLPFTCIIADTPFALAQKTTNEYIVQAAPLFRRSAAGLSTSNSYGICREESGNGKDFSPSTSPLCTIPREPHILLRMYQLHFITLPMDWIFKWHPIRHLSFCSGFSLRRLLTQTDAAVNKRVSSGGQIEGLVGPHLRR